MKNLKMKKSLVMLLAVVITFAFCINTTSTYAASKEKSLKTTMTYLNKGVKDLPYVGNITLNSDNFKSYAFIKKGKGYSGLVSEAKIGSIAHSVVLVRVPSNVSTKKVATAMKKNADPRKWVCVEAEKVIVKYHKKTILLVMSSNNTAKKIASNFDKLYS